MTAYDYLKLPYIRLIREMNDESGHYWYGTFLELDGCQSDGDTVEELLTNLDEAMYGWIAAKLDGGFEVPRPQLTGVSLDQYAIYKLSI